MRKKQIKLERKIVKENEVIVWNCIKMNIAIINIVVNSKNEDSTKIKDRVYEDLKVKDKSKIEKNQEKYEQIMNEIWSMRKSWSQLKVALKMHSAM